jgi:hypothetical protein
MRVHSGLSFNQIDELCQPVGQWEVVGPTGQYYGRFETRPRPDQIPLYAMVKKVDPKAATVRIVDGQPVMFQ